MRRTTVLAIALAIAASCKVYDQSMLLPAEAAPPVCTAAQGQPGTPGLGWWSGCDESGVCYSALAPSVADRPTTSSGSNDITLLFAIRSMRLGSRNAAGELDKNAWQDLGFDLDGVCTGGPTCPSEGEPPQSCLVQGTQIPYDGNSCRDNVFGKMEYMVETTPELGAAFHLNESDFNCSICQGAYNFLFRLSGYNGLPNDNSVRVDIYPSPGLTALKPGIDCTSGTWDPAACWTADDIWTVQTSYVQTGEPGPAIGDSILYDPAGYVRDHVIVIALRENSMLWFPGFQAAARAFPLILQKGIVSGRLVQTQSGWALTSGMIAGRMIWTDALDGFRKLGLCEGNPIFEAARMFAKTSVDTLSTGDVLPDTPCDAISVGIAFEAAQAQVGPLQDVPELVACADAGAEGGPEAGEDGAPDAPAD